MNGVGVSLSMNSENCGSKVIPECKRLFCVHTQFCVCDDKEKPTSEIRRPTYAPQIHTPPQSSFDFIRAS